MAQQIEILDINEKYLIKCFELENGAPVAQLWAKTPKGKWAKEKKVIGYQFGTEQKRSEWVIKQTNKIFETERKAIEYRNEKKEGAKSAIENGAVKVGSIFYNSWGYDQTNIDFYEVVEAKGMTVTVREIGQRRDRTYHDGGTCTPTKGQFKGEPMQKRLRAHRNGIYITMNSYGSCSLWDGTPKGFSDGH